MFYQNPIIRGFYPDPSICRVGNKYYLVCSSFQYFPGVPLFESEDLLNWEQIGYCLTRTSQLNLQDERASGGIYAPTLRYCDGRFYMVTTNVHTGNFYVWTDDIYGEWSDPVFVEQGGIDPSLFFEDGKAYFISNGKSDDGVTGITQCEIDIETGKKLTPGRNIWCGTGGRFLEGPHLYKIGKAYYLMAAEGGTEYGHMVVYAKSDSPYGPFEGYSANPVLTNRDKGGYPVQGVGHADLVQDFSGNWWLVHLAFRQIGYFDMYHHLGREVFLTPVTFADNGWFTAGENGTAVRKVETNRISDTVVQNRKEVYTFSNTSFQKDWCMLRTPASENYQFTAEELRLTGTAVTLSACGSPTFLGLRQKEMTAQISCEISVPKGEAGVTLYMDENHHYDLAVQQTESGTQLLKRVCVGDIQYIPLTESLPKTAAPVTLQITASPNNYTFCVQIGEKAYFFGQNQTKYLSTEVAGGFTGVMIGLYAQGEQQSCGKPAVFRNFSCVYEKP